jgi:lysophospholipase L1-like esterase
MLLAGVAIYLIALEGFLQIAAWYFERNGRELVPAWLSGNRRILCVGDSNTYGLFLERRDAYPQQLEALWNTSGRTREIDVLNAGFPGQNSSHVLRDLPRLLDIAAPELVLLLIGANDYWTRPVAVDTSAQPVVWDQRLRSHSRVFRLIHMLGKAGRADELVVTLNPRGDGTRTGTARFGGEVFELGWEKGGEIRLDAAGDLERNLGALVEQARRRGIEITLLTYASKGWFYGRASAAIRNAARETGASLIDVAPAFESICPTGDCREFFFPDGHPTARGYRLVAETVAVHLDGG